MTQRICAACSMIGTQEFSRCGHILHKECYKKTIGNKFKMCPSCGTDLARALEVEEIFVKLKSSNMHVSDAAELYICLENFTGGYYMEYYKSRSYDEKILENLQKLGFDINQQRPYFHSHDIVTDAFYYNSYDKINLLIDHGLDLEKYDEWGLKYACRNSCNDVIERLMQAGLKFSGDALFYLLHRGNFELLDRVLKLGYDVNVNRNNSGIRLIHEAAQIGSIKFLQILIKNGADFNAVDDEGNSIMHYACRRYYNNQKMVEYLLESGFDIEIQNHKQQTPLMMTAKHSNNSSLVQYLIQNKADINARDIEGNTSVHLAIINYQLNTAEILVRAGADVNAKNKDGKTPLHYVNYKANDIAQLLLEHGADVTILDNEGKSAFYYLHQKINSDLKMKFINSGANLKIIDDSGRTILYSLLDLRYS